MFWLRYLFALLVGSAAVYFLAPAIWERAGHGGEGEALPDGELLSGWESDADDGGPGIGQPPAAAPRAPKAVNAGANVQAPPRQVAARRQAPAKEAPRPSNAVAAEPAAETAAEEAVAAEEPHKPAATDAIPQSADDIIRWGVVSVESGVYQKDGKRLAVKAPGGSLTEISKMTFTSKGDEMALCYIWEGSKWVGPFLVPSRNIFMFEGTRSELLAEDVDGLMKYFKLNAALEARKQALEEEAVRANPHTARLRELNGESQAFAEKVKELTAKRDKATGGERTRISDELRRLETTATKNNAELAKQVKLYEEWKAKHPIAPKSPENDAKCRELMGAMQAMREGLGIFGL